MVGASYYWAIAEAQFESLENDVDQEPPTLCGHSYFRIRQTIGHRTDANLARFIRNVDLFDDAPAARVL